uniref:Uncharacterized protein n=1 Tax=Ditylenchus dipsaci TaxID=166011 RepID=A0A915CU97_9BILA
MDAASGQIQRILAELSGHSVSDEEFQEQSQAGELTDLNKYKFLIQSPVNLVKSQRVGSSEKRFIEYFVQTWLGHINGRRPMFPNELWNCFDLTREGKSKTTNSLEAWHNALKLTLGSPDGKRPRFGSGCAK